MKSLVILSLILGAAIAAPTDTVSEDENSSYKPVIQFFRSCMDSSDVGTCLAVKGISVLHRAARAQSIEVLPGITFSKKENIDERLAKSMSENEIMTSLESENGEKSGRLLDMALEAGSNFLNTHDIQIKLPSETTEEIARALEEGEEVGRTKGLKKKPGRGKKKNKMGGLMMALGGKLIALLPILLVGLKLLVFKALIVSKLAFFLALGMGASKLFSGGGGLGGGILGKVGSVGSSLLGGGASGGSYGGGGGGWSSGAGASSGGWSSGGSYKRSYDEDAQNVAYSAQRPTE